MPYVEHGRIQMSGTLGPAAAPIEIWSCTIKTEPLLFVDDAARDSYAQGVITTYTSTLAAIQRDDVRLKLVKYSLVGPDGLVAKGPDGAYEQSERTADVAGGRSSTSKMPLQTALCLSMSTARDGASGKGRIFIPWPSYVLGAQYTVSDIDRNDAVVKWSNFLIGINDLASLAASGTGRVVVASKKGFNSVVTGVRVGNVPDTMRTRRNALAEVYGTAAVT